MLFDINILKQTSNEKHHGNKQHVVLQGHHEIIVGMAENNVRLHILSII